MPARFTFTVYGEEQVDRTLARYEAADDMTPAWEELADRFLALERRQFATQGRYGSGGWAALSPAYAQWKARHYPGKPILEREGDLVASLTTGPAIRIILPDRMVLGSDVEHGGYHQAGGPHLPRRRPIELPESERREWVRVIQRHIVTGSPR